MTQKEPGTSCREGISIIENAMLYGTLQVVRCSLLASTLMLATSASAESLLPPACLSEQAVAAQPDDLLSPCLGRLAAAAQSDDEVGLPRAGRYLRQDSERMGSRLAAAAQSDDEAGQAVVAGRYLRQNSERKRNMTAADLQPSWSGLNLLAAEAGFVPLETAQAGEARKNTLLQLRAAHAGTEVSKTPLHDIPDGSIVVLGERNGIAYGTWKAGPAGTLPVRNYTKAHDLESRSGVSKDFKAALRRSAKIWSKRLVDDGRRHNVKLEDGTKVRNVHGIVIQTRLHNDHGAASARVLRYDRGADKSKKVYRVYNGRIRIPIRLHDNLHDGMLQTVAHEIGHVLGVARKGTELFKKYYHSKTHTWRGPNAMRANGGKPVPMQWVSEKSWSTVMEPHAEGARRDLGHIGLCVSIMAYCNNRYIGGSPSELDFAFLADIGVTVIDEKAAAETERYGHLSWGEWAVWGASVGRDLKNNYHENPHDFTQAHAEAFGNAPATTLSDNPDLTGTAVWKGSLIGVDLGRARLPPVVGNAKLSVDLGTMAGTASFSDLTVHVNGNSVQSPRGSNKPFRKSGLSYDINVTGNDFTDADGRVRGSFYGPAHQEMAGVLKDVRDDVNLLAGFGGAR